MLRRTSKRSGFSLVELLIVVSLIAIIAGAILPSISEGIPQQLESAARIVARDMAYCRSLGVSNSSTYEVVFDLTGNQYEITHTGADTTLDALPPSVFRKPGDPPDRHIVSLSDTPRVGPEIRLASVLTNSGTATAVDRVEYGPLGETTRAIEIVIWLSAGGTNNVRYIPLRINPMTGIATIGQVQAQRPPFAEAVPSMPAGS